jgi:hypothetical protein
MTGEPVRRGLLDNNIMILRSSIALDELPDEMAISAVTLEGLGAAVDGEYVKDEILAFPPGLVDECADEAGTDAAP